MADIHGTPEADLIFGGASDDLIAGGDERDVLYGGAGDDLLQGGEGDDVLRGESGNDRLEGGAGNDDLTSLDQGSDTLVGGEGNDSIFVDRIRAGDSLRLEGGAGNDRISLQLNAVTGIDASAGDGDDTIDVFMIRNVFTLSLGAGRDILNMVNFQWWLQEGGRIVISDFQAGAAGDRINFSNILPLDFTGWNPNTNPFGAGYLKAVQSGLDVVISAAFTANGPSVQAIVLKNVTLSSLTPENLGGWTANGSLVPPLLLTGTDAGDTLRGNGGSDDIDGQGGDDVLEGHAGADLLKGGDGNDALRGGVGDDQLFGGLGNDSLSSGGGEDSLYGEDGNDTLSLAIPFGTTSATVFGSGGSGDDSITVSSGSVPTSFTIDAGSGEDLVTISSLAGAATIALGTGRDRIDIDSFTKSATSTATIEISDFATGDGGDRLQWTSFVLRTLTGLSGTDAFATGHMRLLQSGADSLLQIDRNGGGDQYVTLITFRNSNAAAFTAYNLGGFAPGGAPVAGATITGTADADRLFGTDGDDIIEGGDGNDVLIGNQGDDLVRGGAGDDSISGYDGDDILEGGDGNDTFIAGRGDDLIDGGEGNDLLDDTIGTGSRGFAGGGGNDSLYFSRSNSQDILIASAGDGDDFLWVRISGPIGRYAIDGGAGDDVLEVSGTGDVVLGTGVDHLRFLGSGAIVQDFVAGDSGDRMSFTSLFSSFSNFDFGANPFVTGHLKLVAAGPDTSLMVDYDGQSGSRSPVGLAILLGVEKFALTSHNIGGYALPFTVGTAADETFQGGAASDEFIGGGGNDTFLVGYGGDDWAVGGAGDDLFFVAAGVYGPEPRSVSITGGGGSDTLQIQSKLSESTLVLRPDGAYSYNAINATGIGEVEFLSGFDSSRGWAAGSAMRYSITIEDGFAAAGAPLVLDTSRLTASEGLAMHAGDIGDPDLFVRLIGGAGTDHIHAGQGGSHFEGAGGDDEFYTGLGDDTIFGGEGNDVIFEDVGYSRSGTDYLDGGAGNDVMSLVGGPDTHWTSVTIKGGADIDTLFVDVQGALQPGVADIDLGTGNDRVQFRSANGTFNVTLGEGSDTVELSTRNFGGIGHIAGPGHNVNIADFDPAVDTLSWLVPLNAYLGNGYVAGQSPFRTGHTRLIQDGADVLLQVSRLADGNFLTLLRFQNRQVSDFDGGLGGYATRPIDGTPGNDILTGTANSDFAYGHAGNDLFRFNQAGSDYAEGGEGEDIAYFANNFNAADAFQGGAGSDELVLQGGGAGALAGITGVERITLLAASDPRFGVTGLSAFGFNLTAAEANLLGGEVLTVDGSGLTATEKLTFNGSAESSGGFIVLGGAAADQLTGGGGNDVLIAGAGADSLNGGTGDDILNGGADSDSMTGGSGNDIFYVDTASDSVSDSSGFDEIRTTLASHSIAAASAIEKLTGLLDSGQTLTGNGLDNVLSGGGGNDVLSGGAGLDVLIGGAGNDSLDGGTSGDTLRGEQGDDIYYVDSAADVVIESAGEGTDSVFTTLSYYTLTANVEQLTGTSSGNQELRGNALSNIVTAGGGSDYILLHDGGTDIAFGGGGTDSFFFGAALDGSDHAHGGAGTDAIALQGIYSGLTFSTGNLTGIEALILLGRGHMRYGGNGPTPNSYDIAVSDDFTPSGAQLHVDGTTLAADETLTFNGSAELNGSFVVGGGAGNDVLTGGAGNDSLNGHGGADTLTGGLGNDVYTVDNAGDVIVEAAGEGTDEVRVSSASYTMAAGASLETLTGLLGNGQSLTGNSAANTINGGQGADVLDGGGGTDVLNGNAGNDTLRMTLPGQVTANGGSGTNTLVLDYSAATSALGTQSSGQSTYGAVGSFGDGAGYQVSYYDIARFVITGGSAGDVIYAGDGVDSLTGGGGDDRLYGRGDNDVLSGGDGKDELDGGLGTDTMTGGAGDDLYEVDSPGDIVIEQEGGGRDVIRTGLAAYTLQGQVEDLVGTNAAGMTLRGSALGNAIYGAGGADLIRLEDGGADSGNGQGGDDTFFFGARFGDDKVSGGEGLDTIVLQGDYARTTISGLDVKGVETLLLLSRSDPRFGAASPFLNHYDLVLSGGFHVDSTSLVIDASGLAANETLTFNAGTSHAETNGFGRKIVVLGGHGADTLTGSDYTDELFGGEGNDRIEGGRGSDLIEGGLGDDILSDSGGTGILRGGDGNDRLTITGLSDWNGASSLDGGNGDDVAELQLYSASSTGVDMGSGNDVVRLTALAGSVTIALGSGIDTIELGDVLTAPKPGTAIVSDFSTGPGGDRLAWMSGYAGGGNPFMNGYARLVQNGADTLVQILAGVPDGPGYQYVTLLVLQNVNSASLTAYNLGFAAGYSGGGGNETFTGTPNSDWMDGGAGDDSLDGGAGADRMAGGTGNDLYFVDSEGDVVTEFGGEGLDEVRTGLATYVLASNVENLTATTDGAHDFRGNSGNNVIVGGAGAEFLRMQDGGDDTILTGAGNDNIFMIGSLDGADVINGGEGRDIIILQGTYAGGLTLTPNITQIEEIALLGGGNTNFGAPGNERYDYVIVTHDSNFAAGVQARINAAALLEGEDFAFDASAETDATVVVYGGRGKDTLIGGHRNDTFVFGADRFAPGDTVDGGPGGYDGIFFRGNYTIDFNAPGYFGLMTSIENMTLTSITDERYSRGGDPAGFDYNITLADNLLLAGVQLTVSGSFLTATETMVVDGSLELDGTLRFFAGKADDVLKGGQKNDLLFGNFGADQLTGNGGADTFRYDTAADSTAASMDKILDFTPGTDKVELVRVDANTLAAGDQAFTWIGSNAFSGTAGELRAFQSGGTWRVEGDTNGDSIADLVIDLTLQGPTPLSSGDFFL